MLMATGIFALFLGLGIIVGQGSSSSDFSLAQRLGLREKGDETEPLFRQSEQNTARWDMLILWTFPAVGVMMVFDQI